MARPGFYNENQNRSYPLQHIEINEDIPDNIIVDFGSMMGAGSGFIEGEHTVYLAAIRRIVGHYEFEFQSDAPGLAGMALIFRRELTDPDYTSSYEEASFSSGFAASLLCSVADVLAVEEGDPALSMEIPEPEAASCPDLTGSGPWLADQVKGWLADPAIQAFMESNPDCAPCMKDWFTNYAETGMTIEEYREKCNAACGDCWDALKAEFGDCLPFLICDATVPGIEPPWEILDLSVVCNCSGDGADVSGAYCYDDTPWSGYLVTGDLSDLQDYLDNLSPAVPECDTCEFTDDMTGAVDLMFLTDTTGSMGGYIDTIKKLFPIITDQLATSVPNITFRWSVVDYRDFEDGGAYTSGYSLGTAFTASAVTAKAAIDALTAAGGGDLAEQQLAALDAIATEWETTFGGQDKALAQRMILWGGDANGWENGSKGEAYPTLQTVLDNLVDADITLFGVNSKEAGRGIDDIGSVSDGVTMDGRRQASTLIDATDGKLSNNTKMESAMEVALFIANAIVSTAEITTATSCGGTAGNYPVEPATTQNLSGSYVRTINVANAERTRSTKPDECRDHCWAFPLKEHYIACTCLQGTVRLSPGFNTNIYQENFDNKLTIEAQPGGGEGPACGPVTLFDTEVPPEDRTTLDGGLACDEVIRSINGVGKRFFEITGGAGVLVTPVPDEHKIIIDVDMRNMAVCADLPEQGSLNITIPEEASCSPPYPYPG